MKYEAVGKAFVRSCSIYSLKNYCPLKRKLIICCVAVASYTNAVWFSAELETFSVCEDCFRGGCCLLNRKLSKLVTVGTVNQHVCVVGLLSPSSNSSLAITF